MLFSSGFYRDRRSSPDYEPMKYERHHLVAEGDIVVSHHTMRTVTAAGDEYENEFAFIFRLEDGRIAEIWEHLDTAHSYASLGLNNANSADTASR
jgi:ketosteroid isomerase-like protein